MSCLLKSCAHISGGLLLVPCHFLKILQTQLSRGRTVKLKHWVNFGSILCVIADSWASSLMMMKDGSSRRGDNSAEKKFEGYGFGSKAAVITLSLLISVLRVSVFLCLSGFVFFCLCSMTKTYLFFCNVACISTSTLLFPLQSSLAVSWFGCSALSATLIF